MTDNGRSNDGWNQHPLALGLFLLGAVTLALRDVITSAIELSSPFVDQSVFEGFPTLTPTIIGSLAVLSLIYGTVGLMEGVKGLQLRPIRRALGFLGGALILGYAFVLIGRLALYVNFPVFWILTLFAEFYVIVAIGSCLVESLRPVQPIPLRPAVKRLPPAPLLDWIAACERAERDLKLERPRTSVPNRPQPTTEEKRAARQEADYWRFVQRMPMRQRALYY